MVTYDIALIGGDGIGPEVCREGRKVLETVAEIEGFRLRFEEYPYGTDHWLDTDETLPESALAEMRDMDAIYLGAIGDPRAPVGTVESGVILGLRFGLDLYVNLRPVKCFAEFLNPLKEKDASDIDFVVVRENTEGAYAQCNSFFKKGTADEIALQEMVNTRKGVERCVRYAYETCRERDRERRLTLVDKSNALRSQDLWQRVFAEVGEEYPDVELDTAYVDAACMWFIKNPEWFDTIVAPNLFGDVITDLGAMLQGGLGLAASGNIHPGRTSMFEPVHGSAPKYAGKNVANPLAAIMAGKMMLDFLGETGGANRVYDAIGEVLRSGALPNLSARSGKSTSEIGDLIVDAIHAAEG